MNSEVGPICGIGLMEVPWKSVSGVINLLINSAIAYHDVLHIFRVGRVTGTSSFESNLLQQMTEMREEVIYEVFLDLRKVYNSLYCKQ